MKYDKTNDKNNEEKNEIVSIKQGRLTLKERSNTKLYYPSLVSCQVTLLMGRSLYQFKC